MFKKIITYIVVGAVVLTAVYIMVLRLGLVDSLDFGAGAYYYADIPGFETLMKDDIYKPGLPFWVYVVLFLGWGWLMYRLWEKVEKK